MRDKPIVAAVGLGLGYCLHRIGFASWDEVHKMFTFASWRMFLSFAGGVALLLGTWWLIRRLTDASWAPRKIHPGTIPGGILFGIGWALCGACPAIALVQLGTGRLAALWTLAGILVGNALYPLVHARLFRWTMGSCADD